MQRGNRSDRLPARGGKMPSVTGDGWKGLSRSAGLLSIASVVSAVGNLAFHVILARSAGVDAYGATVGLLAFGTIAAHLQSGVQYAVAPETALGEPIGMLLRDGAVAVAPWFGVAVVLAFASPAIALFLHIGSVVPVLLALAYAISLVAFGVPAGIFIGRGRFGLFTAYAVVFFGLRFALATWFGWGAGDGRAALAATFLATFISVALAVVVVLRWRTTGDRRHSSNALRKSLAGDSSYGALLSAGLWVTWSLPVFFARHFLSHRAAASFGAAQLLIGGLLFLATPFVSTLYPMIVRHRRTKDVLIGLAATAGVGTLGAIGAALLGPTCLHALYGGRYTASSGEFLFLGLSVTAIGVTTYAVWVSQALRAHRHFVGMGTLAALLAEITLGALWHGTQSLAAGPMLAVALGAAIALIIGVSSSRPPARPFVHNALAAEPPSNTGLLSFTAVGMMVHNEVNSVAKCLRAVLDARDGDAAVATVVVVISGSTDGTEQVCRATAAADPRVRVIIEAERSGKASAVNRFLADTDEPILALVGGDTLLAPDALVRLVNTLADPAIGMAGGRVVPTNPTRGIANRVVQVVWSLHHFVAMRQPKLGEVVAFRRCFDAIDEKSEVDEVSLEAQVRTAGYELSYVPDALIYNHGPTSVRDYLRQRTRIHRGHSSVRSVTGYAASTMQTRNQLRASVELVARDPASAPAVFLAAGLEVVARVRARLPRSRRNPDGLWVPITSAKRSIDVIDLTEPDRLPAVVMSEDADRI